MSRSATPSCIRFFQFIAVTTLFLGLLTPSVFAQCEWQDDFVVPGGLDGTVYDMTLWDDGGGEAIYVAGDFFNAGGVAANRIAKWDGTSWSALVGGSGNGLDGTVNALQVFDGDLYVGGEFTAAGGVTAAYIAKWDGAEWSALGSDSLNNDVHALTVWDNGDGEALYVGGKFITVGAIGAKKIAKWDGTDWDKLVGPAGNGFNDTVLSLGTWNGDLYAGGKFTTAGGGNAKYVARWDGDNWHNLPAPLGHNGVTADVTVITTWHDGTGEHLYLGGWFARVGMPGENPGLGLLVRGITKYDGTDWHQLYGPSDTGVPVHTEVYDIVEWNDGTGNALYAGGNFTAAGGEFVNRVGKWNGSFWAALHGPTAVGIDDNYVYALEVWDDPTDTFGPSLYAAGSFTAAGGGVTSSRIAKFSCVNDDAAAPTGPSTLESTTHVVGVPNAARVIEATWSGAADEVDGSGLAGYSVEFDQSPTTEPDNRVDVPQDTDPHTVSSASLEEGLWYFHLRACDVAGNCAAAQHIGPFEIAVPGPDAPAGIVSPTHSLPNASPLIEVDWQASAGATNYFYEFSASDIPPTCAAMTASTSSPTATSSSLADGPYYFHVCGEDAGNVRGEVSTGGPFIVDSTLTCAWQTDFAVAGGLDGEGLVSEVFNGALYVGGTFTTAGGETVNNIARWDGSNWSALTGGSGTGTSATVRALKVWNGALYVGGDFTTAGGVSTSYVARWTGTEWEALAGGSLDNDVHALEVWNDGGGEALYVGGKFQNANGAAARRIAKWDGASWSSLNGPAGNGTDNYVYVLQAWDDMLYAGGKFTQAGGGDAQFVARYDGTEWGNLPDTMNNGFNGVTLDVISMELYDDGTGEALYMGGWFARVGVPGENPGDGLLVRGIVKYDGTDWHRLYGPDDVGVPVHTEVWSMAVWNDGTGDKLIAGGNFLAAGGVFTSRVAVWDGTEWSSLFGPASVGVNSNHVLSLNTWDDGGGEALFAFGTFTESGGGISSPGAAKYRCQDDLVAPTNPLSADSTSHTTGVPSALTQIDVEWSGAEDNVGGAGLAGYSVLFDANPTTQPDTSIEVAHGADPHSASSSALADGMWYFHLSTCDLAGNCSSAIHLGPYEISTGPPPPTLPFIDGFESGDTSAWSNVVPIFVP